MAHMDCINGVTVVYFNSILAVRFNFFEKCYKSFITPVFFTTKEFGSAFSLCAIKYRIKALKGTL